MSVFDLPPKFASCIEVKNADALLDAIALYQGKKTILIPQLDSTIDIDERVVIDTEGFHLINWPPKSTEIRFGSNGYFSIENADNMDNLGFTFKGIHINGNSASLRAISTENMGAGKRARWLKVLNCRIRGFDAVDAVAIKGKNPELWEFGGNSISSTRVALIDFYDDGYTYGNVFMHDNFLWPQKYGTALCGSALRVTQVTLNKEPCNFVSERNQYYALSSDDGYEATAFNAICNNDDIQSIVSSNDRFENVKVFRSTLGAELMKGLQIKNSPQIKYPYAHDAELIELVAGCRGCMVVGNFFERPYAGTNAIIGVRDENASEAATYDVNRVGGNTFRYFNHAGSGSLYLSKTDHTIEDPINIYTP
jgi:hypothetical protein